MSTKLSEGESLGAAGQAVRVLLVEDNEDDVWLWHDGLKRAGLKDGPMIVRDGVEAIDYLSGNGIYADRERFPFPALVLLDLTLPRLGGFEVLQWWRSEPRSRLPTIVVLTGSAMREDIERAYALGAASYLMKPGHLPEVTELARQTLLRWGIVGVAAQHPASGPVPPP